ncbi:adenylate/guanylate cyclase domain-containing protein [Microvirga thermotolerans]|uniref:adenylate/guanylate cyclase domain-containing protein n=1 Tax=Microvirga thermotolerans TaxID=2651334 RepID=UPI001FE7B9F3|nr:adenylate/guanylate cyclase domain-containing protein [Microvirga thermotolerans]
MRFGPLFWTGAVLFGAGAGALYGLIFGTVHPAISAIYGACTGTLLLAFERRLILSGIQARLRRLSTPLYLAGSVAAYLALIVLGNAVAGSLIWNAGLLPETLVDLMLPSTRVVLYSLAVSAVAGFVLRMRDLIGTEMFVNLLIGRYHRPVSEERVFLFIDLVGSTSLAEDLGDMRFQALLGDFMAALAEPVRRCRGSIDDYIGDMAMVTWPLERGVRDARCLNVIRAIREQIDRDAATWQARFGITPDFRVALHCGPVVTADVGVEKHKIAYFGDTVNTTSRLEALCRELGETVLVSSDLLSRLKVPPGFAFEDLGLRALRGRDQPLGLFALRSGLRRA